MKRLQTALFKASAYTVLILCLFFAYLAFSAGSASYGMPWDRFFVIIGYGAWIAVAELVCSILPLRKIFKALIQYAILLVGFIPVFLFLGAETTTSTLIQVLVAIFFFSVLYLLFAAVTWIFAKLVAFLDSKLDKIPTPTKKEKPEYKSLYDDKD